MSDYLVPISMIAVGVILLALNLVGGSAFGGACNGFLIGVGFCMTVNTYMERNP